MNILIIEDEPLVARDLMAQLSNLEPSATVAGPLTSVVACREWFQNNPAPELIFSDIQLSDGISFEVFEGLHLQSPIIFTTAYDAYAIRAFKLNSIDYLLKPIDGRELEISLKKYKSLAGGTALGDQVKAMLQQWGQPNRKYKERFLALHKNALVPVLTDEVGYFHKEELIFLHNMRSEKLISEYQTLDELESLLDPAQFFRVNRQFLVHIQVVGSIKTTHKGLSIQLKSPFSHELEVSREKATAFKKWMEG